MNYYNYCSSPTTSTNNNAPSRGRCCNSALYQADSGCQARSSPTFVIGSGRPFHFHSRNIPSTKLATPKTLASGPKAPPLMWREVKVVANDSFYFFSGVRQLLLPNQ